MKTFNNLLGIVSNVIGVVTFLFSLGSQLPAINIHLPKGLPIGSFPIKLILYLAMEICFTYCFWYLFRKMRINEKYFYDSGLETLEQKMDESVAAHKRIPFKKTSIQSDSSKKGLAFFQFFIIVILSTYISLFNLFFFFDSMRDLMWVVVGMLGLISLIRIVFKSEYVHSIFVIALFPLHILIFYLISL